MQVFGLPENFVSLPAAEKIRHLTSLPPNAPDEAVAERLEFLVQDRAEMQRLLLDIATAVRTDLNRRGMDELSAP